MKKSVRRVTREELEASGERVMVEGAERIKKGDARLQPDYNEVTWKQPGAEVTLPRGDRK
jgi:hypothetical protein